MIIQSKSLKKFNYTVLNPETKISLMQSFESFSFAITSKKNRNKI